MGAGGPGIAPRRARYRAHQMHEPLVAVVCPVLRPLVQVEMPCTGREAEQGGSTTFRAPDHADAPQPPPRVPKASHDALGDRGRGAHGGHRGPGGHRRRRPRGCRTNWLGPRLARLDARSALGGEARWTRRPGRSEQAVEIGFRQVGPPFRVDEEATLLAPIRGLEDYPALGARRAPPGTRSDVPRHPDPPRLICELPRSHAAVRW